MSDKNKVSTTADESVDYQAKDREAVFEVHNRYMVANTEVDTAKLAEVWDATPTNVYFNLTGHNYRGLEHWSKLWHYYQPRLNMLMPWISWDHNIWVEGDVAWLTCLRLSQAQWVGEGSRGPVDQSLPTVSRATEIYKRVDGEWKAVHVHYSPAALSPRPGNV
ncbi:YybH family protein [Nocardioides terrisoli]|uniref:YybH family protein n=1 Tax=Nocardioides terrisoli TaxID=3388267 RepID=UPI00287BC509|nr:nuclear transport factor 2 family protein [Nocardioides marmorisolisilvae]